MASPKKKRFLRLLGLPGVRGAQHLETPAEVVAPSAPVETPASKEVAKSQPEPVPVVKEPKAPAVVKEPKAPAKRLSRKSRKKK